MNLSLVIWGSIVVMIGGLMVGAGWNWDKFHKPIQKKPEINAVVHGNDNGQLHAGTPPGLICRAGTTTPAAARKESATLVPK